MDKIELHYIITALFFCIAFGYLTIGIICYLPRKDCVEKVRFHILKFFIFSFILVLAGTIVNVIYKAITSLT